MIRHEVSLIIRGDDQSIADLQRLGIGRAWRVGEPLQSSPRLRHKVGGWEVSSDIDLSDALDGHVGAILDAIGPFWTAAVDASTHGAVTLSIALYVTSGPTLVGSAIAKDQLAKLAELGASIDLDVFNFAPHRD
jgi:hypothetical protein